MAARDLFPLPPATTTPAGGILAAVVGAPANGDVPVWDAANGQWVPGGAGGAPSGSYVVMPLTTVTGSGPELVWDADDSLIPTLVPVT